MILTICLVLIEKMILTICLVLIEKMILTICLVLIEKMIFAICLVLIVVLLASLTFGFIGAVFDVLFGKPSPEELRARAKREEELQELEKLKASQWWPSDLHSVIDDAIRKLQREIQDSKVKK